MPCTHHVWRFFDQSQDNVGGRDFFVGYSGLRVARRRWIWWLFWGLYRPGVGANSRRSKLLMIKLAGAFWIGTYTGASDELPWIFAGGPRGNPAKKRCHSHFCNKLLDGAPFKNTQAASTGIWERKTQHTWRVFQQRLICRHELWFLDDSNRSRCIKIQKDLSCFACIPQLLWRKQTHTLPPQVWCEFNLR